MNYRSLLIACLATLGLAVAGWGQADGKDVPADPVGGDWASGDEQWWGGLGRRSHTPPD